MISFRTKQARFLADSGELAPVAPSVATLMLLELDKLFLGSEKGIGRIPTEA